MEHAEDLINELKKVSLNKVHG